MVTVLFDEYDRENWATGGELHIDKFGPGPGRVSAKLLNRRRVPTAAWIA